tara:strand:- start:173 stop:1369 length:1197 start_codon:yes stop_codon:yes gene_type:complete
MVKQMLNTKYEETNEALIEAITNDFLVGLSDDRMDDGVAIISTLVHCTNVLSGNTEGDKKLAAKDIRDVFETKKRSYADLVGIATEALNQPEGWVDRINAILDGMEAEEVNDPVVEEDNTEVVASATTPVDVPDINGLVASAVAEATAPIMAMLQSAIETMKTNHNAVVVVDDPTPQPKVETQPKVEAPSNPSGLDEKKSYGNPKGWSDKTHYSVSVVADFVGTNKTDAKYGVFVCRGLTPEEATLQGRKVVLRRIIQTIDKVNGNKAITKATQSEDWMAVASDSFGITDAVLDSFLTNPNKFQQQSRRTGESLRSRLGITDTETFHNLVVELIDANPQPKVAAKPKASTSTLLTMKTEPTVQPKVAPAVATLDPDEVKAVMATFGMTFAEAKAYLTE